MQAFHNDESIKTKYLNRVEEHMKADRLVRGATGENGKGCAVACTLDMVYDHSRYPVELGIPGWLARVEDTLFEGMNIEKSKTWPKVFLEAINVGADLEKAKTPFLVHILESTLQSMDACVFNKENNSEIVKAIESSKAAVLEMIRCHKEGLDLSAAESAAESAAWSAASAASAARSAARSAASAAWSAASAASAAWSAASAAWSAESAARSAASAARSAAWSAESAAWLAESAESARSAAYDSYADKLIEILKECRA